MVHTSHIVPSTAIAIRSAFSHITTFTHGRYGEETLDSVVVSVHLARARVTVIWSNSAPGYIGAIVPKLLRRIPSDNGLQRGSENQRNLCFREDLDSKAVIFVGRTGGYKEAQATAHFGDNDDDIIVIYPGDLLDSGRLRRSQRRKTRTRTRRGRRRPRTHELHPD